MSYYYRISDIKKPNENVWHGAAKRANKQYWPDIGGTKSHSRYVKFIQNITSSLPFFDEKTDNFLYCK
jgi:hypothetical protein